MVPHIYNTGYLYKIIESYRWIAVQVRQSVRVNRLFLLDDCGDNRPDDGLADDLGGLSLKQPSNGDVAVHALEIGVVAEDLVCDVFGDAFVDIHCTLLGCGELVPLLLLRLLVSQLLEFLCIE